MGAKERLLGIQTTTSTPSPDLPAPSVPATGAKARLLGGGGGAPPAPKVSVPTASATVAQTGDDGDLSLSPVSMFVKALGILDRPRNALFVGAKKYADAVNSGETYKPNPYIPFGSTSAMLFSPQFWQGAWRGLTGQETVRGSDAIKHDFPQFADAHPTATAVLGTGLDIVGDPLLLGGQAVGRAIGSGIKGAALHSLAPGAPEVARAMEVAAGPVGQIVHSKLAPIVRFGAPSAVTNFLRQARSSVSAAGTHGAEEGLQVGKGLTPEMEAEARRLMERPADATVRQAVAAKTGGRIPSAVDVALQESGQELTERTVAGIPKARSYRAVNPAEAKLNQVMETAKEAQAFVGQRLAQVPPAKRFRLGFAGQRQLDEVMMAARQRAEAAGLPVGGDPFSQPPQLLERLFQRDLPKAQTALGAAEQTYNKQLRSISGHLVRDRNTEINQVRRDLFNRILANGRIRPYNDGYLAELSKGVPNYLRSRSRGIPLNEMASALGYESDEALAKEITRVAGLRRLRPEDVVSEAESMLTGTPRGARLRDQLSYHRQAVQALTEGAQDAAVRAAEQPSAETVARQVASERGMDLERLFSAAAEPPAQRLRRLAQRANTRLEAGFAPQPPQISRPDSLKPRMPDPWEIVKRSAQAQGLDADTVFAQAQTSPIGHLRDTAMTPEKLRLGRVAGVDGRTNLPGLARPDTLIPKAVPTGAVDEAAVQQLMQYGIPEPVAQAAVRGRRLTNQIVERAQAEGLPLEGRGEYFPRVSRPLSPVEAIKQRFQRGFFGARDAHAEARTMAPELGIDELEVLRKQGKDVPAYRTDLAIPLAVRNQRANEALAAHRSIKDGFQRFGQGLNGRSPQELAQEGLVAVKYVPKNTNQPFEFARTALPEDPENWVAVPRDLAQGLQAFHKQFVQDEGLAQVANIWRGLHGLWKAGVTVIRPAFYVNNGIGGFVNNLLNDVTNPAAYTAALQAVSGKGGQLATRNGPIPYEQALRMMEDTGVTRAGLTRSLLKANDLSSLTQKPGLLGKAADAGAKVEEFNRAAVFFDRLMKGATAEQAAMDTLATHFDYSNEALTEAERRVREFVPFFIWLKNNAEFQAKKFLQKPQVYNAYVRARDSLSEPGRDQRPSYQKNSIPLGFSIGGNPGVWQSNDPIADALGLVEDPGEKLGGALSPLVKEPMQQWLNYDAFTGRPIEAFPGEKKKLGPWYVPSRLQHAAKALGGAPLQFGESVANLASGAGQSRDVAALVRQFIPGVQVADPQVAMRERVARLRKAAEDRRALARQKGRIEMERNN